jgi:hypothetical protein
MFRGLSRALSRSLLAEVRFIQGHFRELQRRSAVSGDLFFLIHFSIFVTPNWAAGIAEAGLSEGDKAMDDLEMELGFSRAIYCCIQEKYSGRCHWQCAGMV